MRTTRPHTCSFAVDGKTGSTLEMQAKSDECGAPLVVRDNFDWRDLRGLGKMVASEFSVLKFKQGVPHEPVAPSAARRIFRIDA